MKHKRGLVMKQQSILIVDDDRDIVQFIAMYLKQEGYEVFTAYDGIEVLQIIHTESIELVILDIMMPGIDGIEVCRRIRERYNIPIILLSAKSTDVDKVIGLSTGADDYIVKPFSTIELLARVKSQLRRYIYLNENKQEVHSQTIKIKELEIDETARSVTLYGSAVKLTKTEYDILYLMAKNRNRVFTLEEIFESVWKEAAYESNNTVMVHLARLRKKIESDSQGEKIIQNVWGVGYKIEG